MVIAAERLGLVAGERGAQRIAQLVADIQPVPKGEQGFVALQAREDPVRKPEVALGTGR